MPDLRTIVDGLLAQPLTATPPLEHVVERARALRQRRRRQLTAATLAAFALLASVAVAFEREVGRENVRLVDDTVDISTTVPPAVVDGSVDDALPTPGASDPPPGSSTSTTTRQAGGPTPGVGAPPCRPGGTWRDGVTPERIELVTGRGRFGPAHLGVTAVVNRVNREGGVCGRMLHLRVVDEPTVDATSFAVVAPTLEAHVGELDAAGVPMVGGVGLEATQYASAFAWPVGPSMAGVARTMAQHAFESGARSFGIVYDNQPAMTIEGAQAFRQYLRELPGAVLKADVGITPGKPSYGVEASTFNDLCGQGGCDFVAFLLTSGTANTYINSQPEQLGKKLGFGRLLTGGTPLLLNERFARDCGKHCDGMLLWTGFTPPVGMQASDPDVARYVNDVKSLDPAVDVANPFVESAYVGAELFVQALRAVGGNVTRARLQRALEAHTFRSGFTTDLQWGGRAPDDRVANASVRAVRIVTVSGSFVGFQDAGTGWRQDPHPGSLPS